MGKWDDTIKLFIRENAQDLVRWLWQGAQVKGKLLTEFPVRTIEADSLLELELEGSGKRALFHLEFQSTRDLDIPERLLQYSFEARRAHKLPVYSCVIYLRDVGEVPQSPLIWEDIDGGEPVLRFLFLSVELAKVSTQELRDKGLVGLLPLLILTRDGANRRVMEEVVDELGTAKRFELLTITRLLGSLVFTSAEDRQWIERIFAMYQDPLADTWAYQQILNEGIEKGREEGIEKGREEGIEKGREEGIEKGREEGIEKGRVEGEVRGLQKAVLTLVEVRFPPLKSLAEERIARVTKPDALTILHRGMVMAPDADHARFLIETIAA